MALETSGAGPFLRDKIFQDSTQNRALRFGIFVSTYAQVIVHWSLPGWLGRFDPDDKAQRIALIVSTNLPAASNMLGTGTA